jgi:hypothetical protein
MPRYIEIDEKGLDGLYDALDLLTSLDPDAMRSLDLHLYGLTNNPSIVDAAKEAIADSEEVQESDVQLSEVAVAIFLDSRTIRYTTGSGIKLGREDFAYMGQGGEGVRTLNFVFSHYKPTVTLGYFSKMAIASSESWLDDFLRKSGSGQAAQVIPAVHRTEEATTPGVPPAPELPKPGVPKQTSEKLSRFLDDFLD